MGLSVTQDLDSAVQAEAEEGLAGHKARLWP